MKTHFDSSRKSLLLGIASGLFTLLPYSPTVANTGSLRIVAFSENAAPGTAENFSRFSKPVINRLGQIAFTGDLAGPTVDENNDKGVWSEGNGTLALVARSGSAAPGSDENFHSFKNLVLNGVGQAAFVGRLTEGGAGFSTDTGIWLDTGGSLEVQVKTGDAALGTSESFSGFRGLSLNDTGQTAFQGTLLGTNVDRNNDKGIWSEGSGTLALVAREGNAVPGLNANFSSFSNPVLNNAGQIVFRGGFSGAEISRNNNSGIWSQAGSALSLIAREGNVAPGTNVKFSDFTVGNPVVNESGQIAFRAGLAGEGVDTTNDKGTWVERGGSLTLIGREGDAAAGTPANFDLLNRLVLNSDGKMAFLGRLVGEGVDRTNNHAIWTEGGGSLELLARQGSLAPGTNGNFLSYLTHFLNDAGQAGFVGNLSGPDLDFSKNLGIWAQDRSGVLRLVVQKGDLIDVDEGPGTDLREIKNLQMSGGGVSEDRKSSFNNRGQLAFHAIFTDDSSGVFVSNLVAVPEPSSLVLLALAGLSMWRRERR